MNASQCVEMLSSMKSKHNIIYSQSTVVGIIDDTTGKHIQTIITDILDSFAAYLKSPDAVGKNCWEYLFKCEYGYLPALNTEIQKHFDSSLFVRIYGACGAGSSFDKLMCRVNWGAD